jgi:hypothetical protein
MIQKSIQSRFIKESIESKVTLPSNPDNEYLDGLVIFVFHHNTTNFYELSIILLRKSKLTMLYRTMNYLLLLLALLAASELIDRNGSPSVGALSCEAKKSSSIVSTGLRNVGNTCYMNAQLQCAFHIPAVRDIATSISSSQPLSSNDSEIEESSGDQEERSEAALAFKEVVEGMIQAANQKSQVYTPRSFCKRLGIPPMVQQDSQEFWKLLLPAVGVGKFSDLYKGVYEGYISALDGSGREKRRGETFLDLSLDVSMR